MKFIYKLIWKATNFLKIILDSVSVWALYKELEIDRYIKNKDDPIHLWFNLTYASYLVLPRSILQSMPISWQKVFIAHLKKLEDIYAPILPKTPYMVKLRGYKGRFIRDELADYKRGRRYIKPFETDILNSKTEKMNGTTT